MTPPCLRCEDPAAWVVVLTDRQAPVNLCGPCASEALERGWTLSITDGLAVWTRTPTDWMDECSQKKPTPKSEPTSTPTTRRSSKATPARRATRSAATTGSSPRRKSRRTPTSSDSPTSTPKAGRNRSRPIPG